MDLAKNKVESPSINSLNIANAMRPLLINVSATYAYLSVLANMQGQTTGEIAKAQANLQRLLSAVALEPDRANDAVPSLTQKPLQEFVSRTLQHNEYLQEQFANAFTTRLEIVKSEDAVTTFKSYCNTLPKILQEGSETGKALMRYLCALVVDKNTADNVDSTKPAFLDESEFLPREDVVLDKLIAATIEFIRANQPDVLANLRRENDRIVLASTRSQMANFLETAMSDIPDDATYLDMFTRQNDKFNDETSAVIAQRVSNIITKAASTAREAHLLDDQPQKGAKVLPPQRIAEQTEQTVVTAQPKNVPPAPDDSFADDIDLFDAFDSFSLPEAQPQGKALASEDEERLTNILSTAASIAQKSHLFDSSVAKEEERKQDTTAIPVPAQVNESATPIADLAKDSKEEISTTSTSDNLALSSASENSTEHFTPVTATVKEAVVPTNEVAEDNKITITPNSANVSEEVATTTQQEASVLDAQSQQAEAVAQVMQEEDAFTAEIEQIQADAQLARQEEPVTNVEQPTSVLNNKVQQETTVELGTQQEPLNAKPEKVANTLPASLSVSWNNSIHHQSIKSSKASNKEANNDNVAYSQATSQGRGSFVSRLIKVLKNFQR